MASIFPIVFQNAADIESSLAAMSKSYCELVKILFAPETGCFESNLINNKTRFLLEVQGSEIIAKSCPSMRRDIIHAYNLTLINRLDVVLDTGFYVRADDTENEMLKCLLRQIKSGFMLGGSLGCTLTEGYKMWDYIRLVLGMSVKRKGAKVFGNPVPLITSYCDKNAAPCRLYLDACKMLEQMDLVRIPLREHAKKRPYRSIIPRIQLSNKRHAPAQVVDAPMMVGHAVGDPSMVIGEKEQEYGAVIVIDD